MSNSDRLEVERLTIDSLPALIALERSSNPYPWSENLIKAEFGNRYSRGFGYYKNGQLIAYCILHLVLDEVHIVNIVVHEAYKGQGLGRRLLEDRFHELIEEGFRLAYLEVRTGNVPAIRLYSSLGFEKIGVRKKYYSNNGEDALCLQAVLGERASDTVKSCINL